MLSYPILSNLSYLIYLSIYLSLSIPIYPDLQQKCMSPSVFKQELHDLTQLNEQLVPCHDESYRIQ